MLAIDIKMMSIARTLKREKNCSKKGFNEENESTVNYVNRTMLPVYKVFWSHWKALTCRPRRRPFHAGLRASDFHGLLHFAIQKKVSMRLQNLKFVEKTFLMSRNRSKLFAEQRFFGSDDLLLDSLKVNKVQESSWAHPRTKNGSRLSVSRQIVACSRSCQTALWDQKSIN